MHANEYFLFLSLAEVSSWQEVILLKKSIMKFDTYLFLRNLRMYNFDIKECDERTKVEKFLQNRPDIIFQ